MPKKTKKQKLLADLRRKSQTAEFFKESTSLTLETRLVNRQNIEPTQDRSAPSTPTFVYQKNIVTKPKTLITISTYSYVKRDLLKITIFTFLALLFQGVVYFLLRTR